MTVRSFEMLSGSTATPAETLYPELNSRDALRVKLGLPLPHSATTPGHTQFQNSIARAAAVDDSAPSRPRLQAPRWEFHRPLVKEMIHAQEYGSQVTQELVNLSRESFQKECEQYKTFAREAVEAFLQFKDQEDSLATWSYFRRAISFLGSAILLGAGAVAFAAGGDPWAVVLMVAGGANIGNEIMRVVDGWEKFAAFFSSDKEKITQIATGLQISASAVAALTGIIAAFNTANVLQLANIAETTGVIATTAGNMAGGVAAIGEGYNKSKTLDAENKHMQSQARSSEHKAEVAKSGSEIRGAAKANERMMDASAEMLEAYKEQLEMIQAAGAA